MRSAVAIAVAALLAGVGVFVVPFLVRDRAYRTSVPQPSPLFRTSVVSVKPGQQACMDKAVMDVHSAVAQFQVGTRFKPGPALQLTLRGKGYRDVVPVAPGYADNSVLSVPVRAPARPVEVGICFRNTGARVADLYASDDRTHTRSFTYEDGKRLAPNIQFAFFEGRPRSIAERFPLTLRRMSVFRPTGRVLLWPLGILFVLGIPAGILWAFARSVRRS